MYTNGSRFAIMDAGELVKWQDGDHTYLMRENYDQCPADPFCDLYCYDDAIDVYNLNDTYQLGKHETKSIFDQLATIAYDFTGYREDDPEWDACTDPDILFYMDTLEDAIERVQHLIGDQWIILPLYITEYSGEIDFHYPSFYRGDYDCLAIVNTHDVVNNYQVASDMHDLTDKAWQFFMTAIEPYRLYLSGCCYCYDIFEFIGDHYEYIECSGTCYGYNILDNGAVCHGLDTALFHGEYEIMKLNPVVSYEAITTDGDAIPLMYV